MFRYKLRTLLIVLALGPPVLAGLWWWLNASSSIDGVGSEQGLVVVAILTIAFAIAVRR